MFTRRDLFNLIVPLVIEQILNATIGIADTVMVAQVGQVAVSGVSLVDSINLLLNSIFAALATGGAIVAAQYLGREDRENANIAAKQLLMVTTGAGLLVGAVCLIGKAPILYALFGSAESAVMQNAQTYFWISALTYPLIALYNVGAALFRVQGNSRVSMLAALIMNIINISLNALFIFGFHMGVAGAALGSLAARAFAAVFLMFLLHKGEHRIHLEWEQGIRLDGRMVKNILRLGIPNSLENSMFHIGKILVAGLITSFGTVALAANAVSNSILAMAQIPGAAVGLAMITVVGQCVGARDFLAAKSYTIKLMGVSYGLMIGCNLLVFFLLNPIIACFALPAETAEIAWEISALACVMDCIAWPLSFTLPNGLRAANDVRFTMTTSILSMWIFRVGFSYFLGQYLGWGVFGVWAAMCIDWIFRSAVFTVRFVRGRWMNKNFI
ncbi:MULTISPECIES: MATE family efflux transporter [Anaerotruncus]|uniref:MATE family efflux transporter n=1 Tax=Anaerotruncus TaxID=244127 RepID=UPI00082F8967|nr:MULTISPECIES: MATE family efflux transporter [Anaerotruncus]RGX55536.1 MATE family efflux transporter [Anaerotruncus sp. AF02-27]